MNGSGIVEVTLVRNGGKTLKTYLSRREANAMSSNLRIGNTVPVGFLAKGIHWVPQEVPL